MTGGDGVAVSTTAFQVDRDGASPISPLQTSQLWFRVIPWPVGRGFVRQHHYLHQCSGIGRIAFGAFASDAPVALLVGVALFALPPNLNEDQHHTLELQRFVLLDEAPKNAESRFLGWCRRELRHRYPEVERLIAYADPNAGHRGTIYAASGFRYVGLSAPGGTTHGAERRGTPRARTQKHKWESLLLAEEVPA